MTNQPLDFSALADLNGDGQIDVDDINLLKGILQNEAFYNNLSPEDRKRLDMNGDGKLDYNDVVQLIEFISVNSVQQQLTSDISQKVLNLRERLRGKSKGSFNGI